MVPQRSITIHRVSGNWRAGFTLIELILVMAIMILLSGSGIVAAVRFRERQALQNDAREVVTLLRAYQTKARGVELPPGCNGLNYYSLALSATQAAITAVCASGNVAVKTIEVLKDSTFSGATTVRFQVNTGTVVGGNINVDLTRGTQEMRISISESGGVGKPEEI